jgi:hypothetical protein
MEHKENIILTPEEIKKSVEQERKWLEENNAISAVTDGPVEDQEGVPLPADIHQGMPPAHSDLSAT